MATKIVQYIRQGMKSYRATLRLDLKTDTQDITGETIETFGPPENVPGTAEITAVLERFIGTQEQLTPKYSARKVNGVRMYDLARRNEPIPDRYKSITVYRLELESYSYPDMVFSVDCSEGTYIRMLGEDIGRELKLGGTLTRLVRTRVLDFTLDSAITLEDLEANSPETIAEEILLPVAAGVKHLRRVELSGLGEYKFRHGMRMTGSDWSEIPDLLTDGEILAAYCPAGSFLGLAGVVDCTDSSAIILKTAKLIDISRNQ